MAKDPYTVQKFEEDLTQLISKKGAEERQKLIQFKKDFVKDPKAVLKPWDHSFYGSKMLKKEYDFDSDKVKEYFPSERVI